MALVLVLVLTSCVAEPRRPEGGFVELEKQSRPITLFLTCGQLASAYLAPAVSEQDAEPGGPSQASASSSPASLPETGRSVCSASPARTAFPARSSVMALPTSRGRPAL